MPPIRRNTRRPVLLPGGGGKFRCNKGEGRCNRPDMSVPTETRDDAQLLRASREDLDAFAELYDRYAERLLDYFTRRVSGEDTALELCAETLSRAWVSRERFEDQHDGSAAPWLYGI